jgi:hypothetical protein
LGKGLFETHSSCKSVLSAELDLALTAEPSTSPLLTLVQLSSVSPVELHHYVSPQEVIQLIEENFGVAFVAKGVADQLGRTNLAVRPPSDQSLQVAATWLCGRINRRV